MSKKSLTVYPIDGLAWHYQSQIPVCVILQRESVKQGIDFRCSVPNLKVLDKAVEAGIKPSNIIMTGRLGGVPEYV